MNARYSLSAVRLINWHNFVDETIPVDGSLFLIGDNGSGKTTLLDAVHCALTGDWKFELNAAARVGGLSGVNPSRFAHGLMSTVDGRDASSRQTTWCRCSSHVFQEIPMQMRRYIPSAFVVAVSAVAIALAERGTSSASDSPEPQVWSQPQAELALRQLHADFHGAATLGDYELMHSLWTEDAVVLAGGGMHVGPTQAADFFSASPNWGVSASLSPTYNATYEPNGDTATMQFECIIVNTGELDPLKTPLSSIPFGEQNPEVEIVQHSRATCVAVRQGERWLIQQFSGGAGPP